jgi:hypothetical protein
MHRCLDLVSCDCYVRAKVKVRIMVDLAATAVFRTYLLILLGLGLAACVAAPPVQEMSNARQAIKAALDAGAADSAAQELTEARQLLERAEQRFEGQAYREARVSAAAAHGKAKKALSIAQASPSPGSTKQSTSN